MPASPFSVWINLLGSVNPSVPRSINQVSRSLKALQIQAVATNRILAGGFGRLLGLGGALLGVGGVVAGMKQAVELARNEENLQEATYTLLRNQREVRKQNVDLATSDLKSLNAQASRLQDQTGLYEQIFRRGNMTLAMHHLTAKQIEGMQGGIANVLVYQRMQGKSAEAMEQTYSAIGRAIETGMARNLNAVGIILTPMEKTMLMMNAHAGKFADNIKIIERVINRTYPGMAKIRLGTLAGKVDLATANMRRSMDHIGQALRPIAQRLTIIFARLIPLVEPIIIRLANIVNNFMRDHMKDIKRWMDMVQNQVVPAILNFITNWRSILQNQWGRLQDWFKQAWKKLIKFMQDAWSGFFHWLSPEAQANLLDIKKRFLEIWGGIVDWWNKNVVPTLPGVWKDIQDIMKDIGGYLLVTIKEGIENIIQAVDEFLKLVQDLQKVWEAIQNIMNTIMPPKPGQPWERKDEWRKSYKGSRDAWKRDIKYPTIANDPNNPLKVTHYGYSWDPDMDPETAAGKTASGIKLVPGGAGYYVALNKAGAAQVGLDYYKDLGRRFVYKGKMYRYVDRAADKYKGRVLGPRFDIYDPRGNLVPENRPVDLSKLGRDVPTTTTSESARRRGLGGVTLNNTTHYHIYGGDDHKIAALHRQHVDHLMRNLQEAKWRQDRANFDGAMAT